MIKGRYKAKIFIFLFFFLPIMTFGQRKTASIYLKSGYGYYQGIHFGAGYFYDKDYSLGLSIGSDFWLPSLDYDTHYNISIENTIYFGWRQRFISKPWIFGQQAMYWVEGYDSVKWRMLSASMTVGRIFAITHNFGLSFEAGPSYNMIIDVVNTPNDTVESWMWPVMFNGRIQLLYMFR